MSKEQCPICFSELEVRDVTPCLGCGGVQEELEHINEHTFDEMEVFPGLSIVLCDNCQVDFGSFDPIYFGLPEDAKIGYDKMRFLKRVDDTRITKDKFCVNCNSRLSFLKFVIKAREINNE